MPAFLLSLSTKKMGHPAGGGGRAGLHGDSILALRVAQVHCNQGTHRREMPVGRAIVQHRFSRGDGEEKKRENSMLIYITFFFTMYSSCLVEIGASFFLIIIFVPRREAGNLALSFARSSFVHIVWPPPRLRSTSSRSRDPLSSRLVMIVLVRCTVGNQGMAHSCPSQGVSQSHTVSLPLVAQHDSTTQCTTYLTHVVFVPQVGQE